MGYIHYALSLVDIVNKYGYSGQQKALFVMLLGRVHQSEAY